MRPTTRNSLTEAGAGDRGVYLAHCFHGAGGCPEATTVVIKAWLDVLDSECTIERDSYQLLGQHPRIRGVPNVLSSNYDKQCEVYAIVMQLLGPSLEEIREGLHKGRFPERLVLSVAIQMVPAFSCTVLAYICLQTAARTLPRSTRPRNHTQRREAKQYLSFTSGPQQVSCKMHTLRH